MYAAHLLIVFSQRKQCSGKYRKRKDCLERPRKVLARYANSLVVHDEHIVQDEAANCDEKRDRWSSYDPANHREIIEEYEKVEEAKRQLKAEKLKNDPGAEISDDDGNDDKYVDEVDMPGTKVDSKQRITIPPSNLDPNSAYYDPKTRSMRGNPNPQVPAEDMAFKHAYNAIPGQSLTVKILFALPETPQNTLVLNCSHGRLMTKEHIVENYGGEEPSTT
ncbi:hypothetical protein GQX74_000179 [Glossina fuscipes]|nr:hypothetical protein GQX74_000179 [Glossina fuscipes]